MKKRILSIVFLTATPIHALVVGPQDAGNGGKQTVAFEYTHEGGKIEPNENDASRQNADISAYQISYRRKLEFSGFGMDHYWQLNAKTFTSTEEEVNNQVFYSKDEGNAVGLTYGFNLVHQPAYSAGAYATVTPLVEFNKEKFSVPRTDYFNVGLRHGVEITPTWAIQQNVQYGSGLGKKQNAYVSFVTVLAARLREALWWPITLRFGPYAEIDVNQRFDPKYDVAFSAPGRRDRIRSAKFGVLVFADFQWTPAWFSSVGYVQKIGGYDAPATNAVSVSLGRSF